MTNRRREHRAVYACMALPPHLRRVHAPEDDPEVHVEQRARPVWRRFLDPLRPRDDTNG